MVTHDDGPRGSADPPDSGGSRGSADPSGDTAIVTIGDDASTPDNECKVVCPHCGRGLRLSIGKGK